jgi:hypothetical protein
MAVHDTNFRSTIEHDFFYFMCAKLLGTGQSRDVYEFGPDPHWVLKFETGAQSFSNIREWDLWHDALSMGPEVHKWLAPCKSISPCGTVLMQRRTRPAKTFPEKLPAWMTDTKRSNFGMIGKRFVSHDYGNHLVCNQGLTKRLRKAKWWD